MTVFLTVNTLLYLCIVLFIMVMGLWYYAQNVNKRLTQSINLINDLYKLSQNQAKTIAVIAGDVQGADQADEVSNNRNVDGTVVTNNLIAKTVSEVKSSLATDLEHFETAAMKTISNCTIEIEKRLLALENQTLQLQQDSPELKLYSRANKLVKEGVNIEDVIEATQLPRAEVEVLVGLHSHKKS